MQKMIYDDEKFIYYQDGFIDSPQIVEKLLEVKKREEFITNISGPWPDRLIPDGVGEVKIWKLKNTIDTPILSYLCYRIAEVFPKTRNRGYDFEFQITEWQDNSFIPWHTDDNKLCALTCYLENKTDHGGDFLCKPYEDQSIGMIIEPKINRVIFLKDISHSVSKIHKGTRTTLQIWGNKIDANISI